MSVNTKVLMKQILMSSPANLTGDNIIRAIAQWSEVRNALLNVGVDVVVTPELPSGDIFLARAGLLYKDDYIESRFKYAQRSKDVAFASAWFLEHRFAVNIDSSFNFNSCNALFSSDRKHLWLGLHDPSTDMQMKTVVDLVFDRHEEVIVRPLEIITQHNLDEVFCPLATGELLWYPQAFSTHSRMVVESWYEGRMIEVDMEDGARFACNSLSVRDTIIMPLISEKLQAKLLKRGYDVVQVDVSELIKRGGACKCLTIEVTE